MADADLWHYVFSPRAMAIDAVAGLCVGLLFLVVRGRAPRRLRDWLVIALVTSVVRHLLPGGAQTRSMPIGYVGQMATLCMQRTDRETCLCAVDGLKARIGETALVQLAVKADVNAALPKEFLDELPGCGG